MKFQTIMVIDNRTDKLAIFKGFEPMDCGIPSSAEKLFLNDLRKFISPLYVIF